MVKTKPGALSPRLKHRNEITAALLTITPVTASTITPAGVVEADLPDKNTWGFDSWGFMEVRVPTISKSKVILDEEIESEEIPVLQFVPNDGWIHLLDEDGAEVWGAFWAGVIVFIAGKLYRKMKA